MMKKLALSTAMLMFLVSGQGYARFMPDDFKIKKESATIIEEGDC